MSRAFPVPLPPPKPWAWAAVPSAWFHTSMMGGTKFATGEHKGCKIVTGTGHVRGAVCLGNSDIGIEEPERTLKEILSNEIFPQLRWHDVSGLDQPLPASGREMSFSLRAPMTVGHLGVQGLDFDILTAGSFPHYSDKSLLGSIELVLAQGQTHSLPREYVSLRLPQCDGGQGLALQTI